MNLILTNVESPKRENIVLSYTQYSNEGWFKGCILNIDFRVIAVVFMSVLTLIKKLKATSHDQVATLFITIGCHQVYKWSIIIG